MENISKIKNIIWQIANPRLAFAILLVMALLNFMGTNKLSAQTTLVKMVAASSDDAEESGTGAVSPYYVGYMYLISSDLEIVEDWEPSATGVQKIGLRFTGITIPKGSTITNAYLTFKSIAADSPNTNDGATNLTIKGHLAANSLTFLSTNFDITNRPLTTASTSWPSVVTWTGDNNPYNSPDIKNVVQEIVNQSTWASGNALSIIITGTGSRSAYSYDNNASRAPQLTIIYTECNLNATVTKTNLSCNVTNDGSITVSNPTGGSGAYQYQFNGGAWQSGTSFTGLTAGTYTLKMRDANNIACEKDFGSYTISTYTAGVNVGAVSTTFSLTSPISLTHTTGTGNNRLMLVGVSQKNKVVTSVTYGGVELDLVGENITNGNARTHIYMLQDPPSGSATVQVNFDANPDKGAVVGVMTFTNVSPSNPLNLYASDQANSTNPTLTNIPTSTNERVFNVVALRNTDLTGVGTNQTQRWNINSGSEIRGGGSTKPGDGATTSMSWISNSGDWSMSAVSIKPILTADLGIVKTVNNPAPYAGQTVTFTLTATNYGCDNATGASVNDALPNGYIYSSSSTANGTYDAGSGEWTIGTLNTSATATLTIQATVLASGNYQNTATISSDASDLVSGNNSASVGITVCQAGGNAPLFNNN